MNKILGVPKSEYEYEFMVVKPTEDGDFRWFSNHKTAEAYRVAEEVGGVVVHNVRVSGKKKRER